MNMDTSTPTRSSKSTYRRKAIILSAIAEDTDNDISSPSVFTSSPSCYTPAGPESEFSQRCESVNLDKSTELFPFSPIACSKRAPHSLLPLLDTPNFKWSTSILTPCGMQPQNEVNLQNEELLFQDDSDVKQESADYTASSFPIFDDVERANSTTEPDFPKPVDETCNGPVSPVLSFNTKSKAKKSCRTVKKLFSVTENEKVHTEISYQRMSDMTMDAFEQICQISETLYSNSLTVVSSEPGPSSSSTDPLTSSAERIVPSGIEHVNMNELSFTFNTSFDLVENCRSPNLFESSKCRKNFVYPFDVTKKPECTAIVDDVIESVFSLEQCDRVFMTKSKPVPREMVLFSQLSTEEEGTGPVFHSTAWDIPDMNFDLCTFWNYQRKPFHYSYLTRTMQKYREAYRCLKSFFELCRVDFAQVVSQTRDSAISLDGVSAIVNKTSNSSLNLPLYLRNWKANILLNRGLGPLKRTTKIKVVHEFLEYFRCHFDLVYNQSRLKRSSVCTLVLKSKKRKHTVEMYGNESKRKLTSLVRTVTMPKKVVRRVDSSSICLSSDENPVDFMHSVIKGTFDIDVKIETSDTSDPLTTNQKSGGCVIEDQICTGFRTAGGRHVTSKSESLAVAEIFFNEMKDAFEVHRSPISPAIPDQCVGSSDLVNGKCLTDRGRSLVKGHQLLGSAKQVGNVCGTLKAEDVCNRRIEGKSGGREFVNMLTKASKSTLEKISTDSASQPPPFFLVAKENLSGFTTANGKNLIVDPESLARASKLLEDMENSDFEMEPTKTVVQQSKATETTSVPAYTSTQSVNLLRKQVNETAEHAAVHLSLKRSGLRQISHAGFSTANGKHVQVKKESLVRAEALMKSVSEIDLDVEPTPDTIAIDEREFLGLSTTTEKPVTVVEKTIIVDDPPLSENITEYRDRDTLGIPETEFVTVQTDKQGDKVNAVTGITVGINGNPSVQTEKFVKLDDTAGSVTKTGPVSHTEIKFSAFHTASGKSVHINEQSLADVELMMKNVSDLHSETGESLCTEGNRPAGTEGSKPAAGLSTANGKPVDIREQSVIHAGMPLNNVEGKYRDSSASGRLFAGFNTAAGKSISVQEKSLARAEVLFKNVVEGDEVKLCESASSRKCTGFSTAVRRPCCIQDQSFANAEAVLRNVLEQPDPSESVLPHLTADPFMVAGFSTAAGKPVTIQKQSLTHARMLLEHASEETDELKSAFPDVSTKSCTSVNDKHVSLASIQEQSLASAGIPLRRVAKEADLLEPSFPALSNRDFAGFSTAAGKPVGVQEQSLSYAKTLFKNIVEETDQAEPALSKGFIKPSIYANNKLFAGFSTAAGEPIHVREESLADAKTLLINAVKETDQSDFLFPDISTKLHICAGGQSAGHNPAVGKSISVCEQSSVVSSFSNAAGTPITVQPQLVSSANAISEKVLEETESESILPKLTSNSIMQSAGFSTAAGKLVTVQEESLAHAKALMQDVFEETDHSESVLPKVWVKPCISPSTKLPTGFSTAAGKQVNVKEYSLASAQTLLRNVMEESNELEPVFPKLCTKPVINVDSTLSVDMSYAAGKLASVQEKPVANADALFKNAMEKTGQSEVVSPKLGLKSCVPTDSIQFTNFYQIAGKLITTQEKLLARAEVPNNVVKVVDQFESAVSKEWDKSSTYTTSKLCTGFSTVAGESVNVQKQSLTRAEILLKDVIEEANLQSDSFTSNMTTKVDIYDSRQSCKFSPAAGKRVEVERQSLAHAESLLQSVSEEVHLQPKGRSFTDVKVQTTTLSDNQQLAGFSSAGEARIEEKSLTRVAAEQTEKTVLPNTANNTAGQPVGSAGIRVEEESLWCAEALLKSAADEAVISLLHVGSTSSKQPVGFYTAAGTRIKVKEESLAQAEALLLAAVEETDKPVLPSVENTSSKQLFGFTTAAGTRIKVKEESLAQAEALLLAAAEKTDKSVLPSVENTSSKQLFGFTTAAGTRIKVKEESLAQAEALLLAAAEKTDKPVLPSVENTSSKQVFGFATAAGTRVEVKEESLARAEALLLAAAEEVENPVFPVVENATSRQLIGFTTAAGTPVQVKEESLARAQELLLVAAEKTEEPMIPSVGNTNSRQFVGFTTAARTPVQVEEESLARAEALLATAVDEAEKSVLRRVENTTSRHAFKVTGTFDRSVDVEALIHVTDQIECAVEDSSTCIKKSSFVESPRKTSNASTNRIKDFDPPESLSICKFEKSRSTEVQHAFEEELSNLDVDQFLAWDFNILKMNSKSELPAHEVTDNESADIASHAKVETYFSGQSEACTKRCHDSSSCQLPESATTAMKSEQKTMSFQPVIDEASPLYFDSADESSKSAQPDRSKPSSPVFETSRGSRQKRLKKRKTQNSVLSLSLTPLNVTYGRKDNDSNSSDKNSPEDLLKKFKDNFAHRSSKRKEAASSMVSSFSKRIKEDTAELRRCAVMEQQKYIATKGKEDCKPLTGWYMKRKENEKRMTLNEAVRGTKPGRFTSHRLEQWGVSPSIVAVNAENAADFVFPSAMVPECAIDGGFLCGDECKVIPNENNEVRFEDLARAFMASPGVDPKLITESWIRNHYRWIVWKLASVERSYPQIFGGRYLTLDNVLYQLKFRYDREVDRCERSALKRIYECDDSASKPMVLCIASIKPMPSSLEHEVELTDGWYSIRGLLDIEMHKLISKKKVVVGTKLMMMNAEVVGLTEGCDPLQVNSSVRLKVSTNSSRRVRWYTRLGFYNRPAVPVIRDLRHVLPNGGVIHQLSAVIARIYPLLYMEKKDNGYSEVYNEKSEFKKVAEYEKKRQACLETLASQVTREIQRENGAMDSEGWYSNGKSSSESVSDQLALQAQCYDAQERMRYLIQEKVEEKLPEEFRKRRQVICLLKARLVNEENEIPTFSALITIWHPSEDITSLLAEGKIFSFHHVNANDIRNGELRLSTSRMTQYELRSSLQKRTVHQRRFTSISELKSDFLCTFGEIDTVGVVIDSDDADEQESQHRHTVYMADLAQNIVAVKFRSNLKDSGFEDTLKRKRIVAGVNMQWKRGSLCWKIPVTFATEYTLFTHKSRYEHLQCWLDEFENYFKTQSLETFVAKCEKKLIEIIRAPSPMATSTPVKISSNELLMSTTNSEVRTSLTKSVPVADKSDSSFDLSDNLNRSAASKSIQLRIEKLRGYGEPPPLSPITMTARPKRAKLSIQTRIFKSNEKP